jgi:dinuclear metal center YbgI/SA1388 family protein
LKASRLSLVYKRKKEKIYHEARAMSSAPLIQRVAAAMESIAPLRLADTTWDNVGILVENPKPNAHKRVMLTIDLTPDVLNECVEKQIGVIVSYHPPIFSSMKRLTLKSTKQEIVLRTIAEGMSIFSPHTSLDAATGGMNDWLASIVDPSSVSVLPIVPSQDVRSPTASTPATTGMGRVVSLGSPITLEALVQRIKTGLALPTVRVAVPGGSAQGKNKMVRTVAICAGSGSSVFRALKTPVDVLLSGEMGHHDVLAAADADQAVILCEHTNTERGFLRAVLKNALGEALGDDVTIDVSTKDADPLVVW